MINSELFLEGYFYFCFHESKEVTIRSDYTKIIASSFLMDPAQYGTSTKIFFDGDDMVFGDFRHARLEFLTQDLKKIDIDKKRPLRMDFYAAMPCGIFIIKGSHEDALQL